MHELTLFYSEINFTICLYFTCLTSHLLHIISPFGGFNKLYINPCKAEKILRLFRYQFVSHPVFWEKRWMDEESYPIEKNWEKKIYVGPPRTTELGQNKKKIFPKISICRFTGILPYEKIKSIWNLILNPKIYI